MARSTPIAQIPHTVDIADDDETVQEVLNQIAESSRQSEEQMIENAGSIAGSADGTSANSPSPHLHHQHLLLKKQQQAQLLQQQLQQQQMYIDQQTRQLETSSASAPPRSNRSPPPSSSSTPSFFLDFSGEDSRTILLVVAICIAIQVVPIDRIARQYIPVIANYSPYSDILVKAAAGGLLFYAIRKYAAV